MLYAQAANTNRIWTTSTSPSRNRTQRPATMRRATTGRSRWTTISTPAMVSLCLCVSVCLCACPRCCHSCFMRMLCVRWCCVMSCSHTFECVFSCPMNWERVVLYFFVSPRRCAADSSRPQGMAVTVCRPTVGAGDEWCDGTAAAAATAAVMKTPTTPVRRW